MNIKQIREDTLYCEEMIHFNNAGASLPCKYVNVAIKQWLDEEERIGGYEMEAKYADRISSIYEEIAKLIKCQKDEIAITDNASTAFSKALYAIPFEKEDEIITSDAEYVNNFLNFLKLQRDKGVKIITVPRTTEANIDLEKLKNCINAKTKLIAITHMPTSSGSILPIKEIGQIAADNGILYLVDSCQSIGHYPVFVDEVKCDFLTATSRKYLRGPRGLGFLYARRSVYDHLDPFMLEAMGANWESEDRYELNGTSKMFECFEKPYGFMMGFQQAIKYANDQGIEQIWERIRGLSEHARQLWSAIPGISIHDGNEEERSGIITLTKQNIDPSRLQQELARKSVNSSLCKPFTSLTDMQAKGLASSNRLSLHYYNTEEEIESVSDILQNIK